MNQTQKQRPRPNCLELLESNPYLAEIASQHGRMVEIAILHGDKYRAWDVVFRAFDLLEKREVVTASSLVGVIIEDRLTTILEKNGIETIGQLCTTPRQKLMDIPQINERSLEAINQSIRPHGWSLRD